MWKALLFFVALLGFPFGSAQAQSCGPVPYALTNGTTADASQVMANFNFLSNCQGQLRGYLGGLTMSNDIVSPNTVIDTATGVAASDDATMLMKVSAITKNANAAWAAGGGSGCLDSGSTLVASTWYHLFVIGNPNTGAIDEVCSTSAASPNLPSGYTKKRRIGSFRTNGSSQILAFVQNGDQFWWKSAILDANSALLAVGARAALPTLTVPTSIQPDAIFTIQIQPTSAVATVFSLTSFEQNDTSNAGQGELISYSGNYAAGRFSVRANASAQVFGHVYISSVNMWINTLGWVDNRGRFN